MALPKLTPEQREEALARAAAARQVRAEVKNRLKNSGATLGEVIAQSRDDAAVAKLKVTDVLRAMPGVGEVKAREIMDRVGIADNRRLRGLGDNQVRALLAEFTSRPE
jgi:hypothetical protein